MKKKMLAFASAMLSVFWLAVLLISAKTEKAQFLGKWDSLAVDGGGNKTLSLIASGPASSLLARLYEDNTSACGVDQTRRPIQAASDMGRFSESAYTLSGNLNLMPHRVSAPFGGGYGVRFIYVGGMLARSSGTTWYPMA